MAPDPTLQIYLSICFFLSLIHKFNSYTFFFFSPPSSCNSNDSTGFESSMHNCDETKGWQLLASYFLNNGYL